MPRPVEESRVRRFMMQSIMWVVLGATVGAAALVDRAKQRALHFELGEPMQLEGFSIRLPQDWVASDEFEATPDTIIRKDPNFGDFLAIATRPRSLTEFFGLGNDGPQERIPVGNQLAPLTMRVDREQQQIELRVTRLLPSGRVLTLSLLTTELDRRHLQREKDVLKKVAASVQVDQ